MSIDVSAWRGLAQDADAERTAAEASDRRSTIRLRRPSRALLADLLRPHRRPLALAVTLLLLQNAANTANRALSGLGRRQGSAAEFQNRDSHSFTSRISVADHAGGLQNL